MKKDEKENRRRKKSEKLGGEKKRKMKTKNKLMAMVEIAVVLCSMFFVAIPAIVADQTTQKISATEVTAASEDDFVLGIYGNANEDDTIDMGDVVYTKLAIFGKKSKTELCDAKYDGRVNVLDVIQTKLIILGKEKQLTVIDAKEHIVTVKKPLRRVIVFVPGQFETLRSLNAADTIVGMPQDNLWDPAFFPEMSELTSLGYKWNADIETILNLHPDAAILHTDRRQLKVRDTLEKTDPNIALLTFACTNSPLEPTLVPPDLSSVYPYPKEVRMLGYIFDKREEAEEFGDWYEDILNSIKEEVDTIPEKDKPKVYYEFNKYSIRGYNDRVVYAGGKNIFEEGRKIDPEAVIDRDPDIIVNLAMRIKGGYDKDADDITELRDVWGDFMNPDDPEYRPELAKVSAVRNNRIYVLANVFSIASSGANGARCFIEVAYMAKWFHPTLFEDLDPKAIHQEYITRFQGLDIDLDKKGVFVYLEPS